MHSSRTRFSLGDGKTPSSDEGSRIAARICFPKSPSAVFAPSSETVDEHWEKDMGHMIWHTDANTNCGLCMNLRSSEVGLRQAGLVRLVRTKIGINRKMHFKRSVGQ